MIVVERHSSQPAGPLWSVLSNLAAWQHWSPTVEQSAPVVPGMAGGVGVSYRLRQPGLRPATWTVTEWSPGAGFAWRSRVPGVTSLATHQLVALPTGTRIRLTMDWRGLLAGMVRRRYAALTRDYLEQEAAALDAAAHASGRADEPA